MKEFSYDINSALEEEMNELMEMEKSLRNAKLFLGNQQKVSFNNENKRNFNNFNSIDFTLKTNNKGIISTKAKSVNKNPIGIRK